MSAMVVADEIARFNQDERVLTRLYLFLSCFLWPLTALALWVGMLLLETVLLESPLSRVLRDGLVCTVLAGFIMIARSHLRSLRMQEASVEAFYTRAVAEPVGPTERPTASSPVPLPGADERPVIVGMLLSLWSLALSAPRLSAKGIFSSRRALAWDEATCTAAKTLFESLGATGGAWVPCSAHPGAGHLLAGLELLGLIEHRHNRISEVRLLPEMRVRYFPKDPSQAMYQGPPRRS